MYVTAFDTLLLEGGSLPHSLDALAAVGDRDFQRVFAVSAGAMAVTSFLSGQRNHFIEVATEVVSNGQFIRFSSAFSEEGIMNLAHLFDHVRHQQPLDLDHPSTQQGDPVRDHRCRVRPSTSTL